MPKKQKSGLYRSKVTIGVDADGKKIYKYISGKTKRELEAARQEVISYYIDHSVQKDDRLFGEYAIEWYKLRKEPLISSSMQASYRSMLNKHVLPAFGDRNLRAISAKDIQEWINTFAQKSDTTVTLAMTVIRSVMQAACADGYLNKDPSAYLVKPKCAPEIPRRALTSDETSAVLDVIQRHEHGDYMATLYYLGVRPGEARGLQWGDFDWAGEMVHVQRDIDYTAPQDAEGDLKTDASDRFVPIPDELYEILHPKRGKPTEYLFQARFGKPWSKSSAERIWLSLMEMAGLVAACEKDWKHPDIRSEIKATITPYYLRHNFITMCWEAGLDPLITMRIVGHEDYHTTASIYTHLKNEHLKRVKQDMGAVFDKKKK